MLPSLFRLLLYIFFPRMICDGWRLGGQFDSVPLGGAPAWLQRGRAGDRVLRHYPSGRSFAGGSPAARTPPLGAASPRAVGKPGASLGKPTRGVRPRTCISLPAVLSSAQQCSPCGVSLGEPAASPGRATRVAPPLPPLPLTHPDGSARRPARPAPRRANGHSAPRRHGRASLWAEVAEVRRKTCCGGRISDHCQWGWGLGLGVGRVGQPATAATAQPG